MALTRKMLKAMSIEDEKIDQIIDAHSETVDALKAERDKYKEEADKVPDIKKKLDEAIENQKDNNEESWKVKYEALKEEFDGYKNDVTEKETKAAKTSAYKNLLKEVGISEKRIDSVLKVSDINKIELDKDGKIKGADKLTESVKSEWSDFIINQQTQGAQTANPPSNNAAKTFSKEDIRKMSTAEINANWDSIKTSLKNQ